MLNMVQRWKAGVGRNEKKDTFRSIQALRALAALLVLFFHMSNGHFVIGAAGVDLFFVISGFVMGTVGIREDYPSFLLKRIVRVVPLYWAVTGFMCLGAVFGAFSTFAFSPETLIKSLLFIPYTDASGHIWPLVVVGWTLNIEMLFYTVFALGLFFGAARLFSAIVLSSFVVFGLLTAPASPVLIIWTSPLLLEFVAGLMLSSAFFTAKLGTALLILLAGVAGLFLSATFEWYEESTRLLTWGLPSFLIVAGCVTIEREGWWPSTLLQRLGKLGDASYSLYLTHGIIVAAVHRAIGSSFGPNLIILFGSVSLAFASYYLFERPIIRLGRQLTAGAKPEQNIHIVPPK